MKYTPYFSDKTPSHFKKKFSERFHIDFILLFALLLLTFMGLAVLYSASNGDMGLVYRQGVRLALAYIVMLLVAQIPPESMRRWAPGLYIFSLLLLLAVLFLGEIGKGAQRWLDLGIIRFQPSEMMKLAIPLCLASFLSEKALPPSFMTIIACCFLLIIPTLLTAKQPDLGTALMLAATGAWVLFLAGLAWRFILLCFAVGIAAIPALWFVLHDYQKQRIFTFFNPESDPLGNGYHIIQSKIAIGSGGLFGKGWLAGTQSHLNFLPEHATDFIFAVLGEEFGLVGCLCLFSIVLIIILRGLYISAKAQDTFTRLLSGSLILTFFLSVFINIGMVCGLLPVVGVPLPLFSYGGTSMVTLMASFGVLMSVHTHKRLLKK